jgi:hypothetical protein
VAKNLLSVAQSESTFSGPKGNVSIVWICHQRIKLLQKFRSSWTCPSTEI